MSNQYGTNGWVPQQFEQIRQMANQMTGMNK